MRWMARRTGTGMVGFLLQRIAYGLAVLFAVTSLVFGLLHLSGDPLAALVPPGSSPEQAERLRAHFGLDRPLPVQYATFVRNAVRGDFGESWRARRPAMATVLDRLPATLALTGAAVALALAVGVSLGIAAGSRPGGVVDLAATALALGGQAVPGFWLGTILILFFAVRLQWLPSSGGEGARAVVLPAVTLAAYPAATIARLLRSSLIETLSGDYIRTARGKGLSTWAVVRGHALRNAALPTLAFVGLQVGFLLGGAVVVEGVFAYPGVGQLALQAVANRDLPVVQAFVVVVATLIVVVGFAVDVLARWIDPRLRSADAASGGSW
ncbi:MAG: peptide/nickel transport system permease protein [Thermomicrobiales bacterium]|nr:peptide/nickel transport system permease protein [Thermomicrobiales bacterium]